MAMAIDLTGVSGGKIQNSGENSQVRVSRDEVSVSQEQTGKPRTTDTVSLTDMASRLQKLETGLASLPVVDAQRVEGIKQAITNGSFEIDTSEVAAKVLTFEASLGKLHA